MTLTGYEVARQALREIGVLDPIEPGEAENLVDALQVAELLLDTWNTEGLTVGVATRSTHDLAASTQAYLVGPGQAFDLNVPAVVESWSVIPDGGASQPQELPMGRPATAREWAAISVKNTEGAYPTVLWFDPTTAGGFASVSVWPIPSTSSPDVVLYARVPTLTSLAGDTSYTFQPGMARALALNLAVELGASKRYGISANEMGPIAGRAARALGRLKVRHAQTPSSALAPGFAIGHRGGRRYDLKSDA